MTSMSYGSKCDAKWFTTAITLHHHSYPWAPANPSQLWEDHKVNLADDYAHWLRQRGIDYPTEDQIYSLALLHIQDELATTLGKTLLDYRLPELDQGLAAELHIKAIILIRDQLETDLLALQEKLKAAIPTLNVD